MYSFYKVSFYKLRTKSCNKITKPNSLHDPMITHTLMFWFRTFDWKQKTENTERQKLVFQKKCRKCRPTQTCIRQSNDCTRAENRT